MGSLSLASKTSGSLATGWRTEGFRLGSSQILGLVACQGSPQHAGAMEWSGQPPWNLLRERILVKEVRQKTMSIRWQQGLCPWPCALCLSPLVIQGLCCLSFLVGGYGPVHACLILGPNTSLEKEVRQGQRRKESSWSGSKVGNRRGLRKELTFDMGVGFSRAKRRLLLGRWESKMVVLYMCCSQVCVLLPSTCAAPKTLLTYRKRNDSLCLLRLTGGLDKADRTLCEMNFPVQATCCCGHSRGNAGGKIISEGGIPIPWQGSQGT